MDAAFRGLRVQPTASAAPPHADLSISIRRKPPSAWQQWSCPRSGRRAQSSFVPMAAGRRVARPRGPTVCEETPGTQAGSCTPSFPKRMPTDSLRGAEGPWLLPEHPPPSAGHAQTWRTRHGSATHKPSGRGARHPSAPHGLGTPSPTPHGTGVHVNREPLHSTRPGRQAYSSAEAGPGSPKSSAQGRAGQDFHEGQGPALTGQTWQYQRSPGRERLVGGCEAVQTPPRPWQPCSELKVGLPPPPPQSGAPHQRCHSCLPRRARASGPPTRGRR